MKAESLNFKIPDFKILNNGDSGLSIVFTEATSENLTRKIVSIEQLIRTSIGDYLIDIIPSYQSITLLFSLLLISKEDLKKELLPLLSQPIKLSNYQPKQIEIPVCYQLDYALDLPELAKYCEMSTNQVIKLHIEPYYFVHMLGFLPGFLYLGGLNSSLKCPRKRNPELRVPAGSVAIGGEQTGVYPTESPGGWHVIGRTPLPLFRPNQENLTIASPLDRVKFVPIEKSKFLELEQQSKERLL